MKKIVFLLVLLMLMGCRLVETANQPVKFNLEINSRKNLVYQVWHMKKSGRFEEIKPDPNGLYVLDIPSMSGGYKQFLWIKYDIHDPNTYKIIEIRQKEKNVLELSVDDLEKLNQSVQGYKILVLE